jgi:hypothetical protein
LHIYASINNDSLRMIIKSSFDPKIEWELPEGDVPYTKNDAPEGTEHTLLAHEARKLYHFIKGGNPQITQNKRESMFVQMLEGLHKDEAKLLDCCKGQEVASGLQGTICKCGKEAFNWTDELCPLKR